MVIQEGEADMSKSWAASYLVRGLSQLEKVYKACQGG